MDLTRDGLVLRAAADPVVPLVIKLWTGAVARRVDQLLDARHAGRPRGEQLRKSRRREELDRSH
jgi:hypothetical protein